MDTTTTELAVEIIDAILSHLVDGSPTVRACRLVCRIWHSLSCYRHSKTTTLLVTGDQVPLLLGLLQSPNCTIHGWLRGITLAAPEDGPTDLLPALLPRFSELHRLRMIGIKAASPQICEMPVLPGITSLHIEGIRMRSFACFTGLLWKLPNLRELTLDRVWYNYISLSVSPPPSDSDSEQDDDEDREYNQPQPPDSCPTCAHVDQLQRVSLDTFKLDLTSIVSTGYRDRELLDWLSSEATAPIVTHFRVYPKALEPRGILKFMQYLDHIGDSLQSLHVVFHSKAYLERLNFNHYRSLTTLRIAFLSAFHYWGLFLRGPLLELLVRALAQCSTLHTLVFDVPADAKIFLKLHPNDLDRLGDVLGSAVQLRQIRFNVLCQGHIVDAEGNLAEGHFDWNDEDEMCEAESVFRKQLMDRLGLENPEICTLQLSERPVDVDI